jgi:hypothetical protein
MYVISKSFAERRKRNEENPQATKDFESMKRDNKQSAGIGSY